MIEIKLQEQKLDTMHCIHAVTSPESGGIDVFIGTVRSATQGRKVVQLEFEAYGRMAEKEMKKLAENAMKQWPLHNVIIHHRTGILTVGETAVIIAVSAAHRDAAFSACRYIIDTLKQTVPIWKKEIFEDGETWVSAHP